MADQETGLRRGAFPTAEGWGEYISGQTRELAIRLLWSPVEA